MSQEPRGYSFVRDDVACARCGYTRKIKQTPNRCNALCKDCTLVLTEKERELWK